MPISAPAEKCRHHEHTQAVWTTISVSLRDPQAIESFFNQTQPSKISTIYAWVDTQDNLQFVPSTPRLNTLYIIWNIITFGFKSHFLPKLLTNNLLFRSMAMTTSWCILSMAKSSGEWLYVFLSVTSAFLSRSRWTASTWPPRQA